MATIGESFPEFTAPSHEGGEVNLEQYRGKDKLVIFFYPKAMTSGCIRETTEFGARRSEFDAISTKIVGVSVDPAEANQTHAVHCAANFPILSDLDGKLIDKLGIKRDTGTAMRTTYVIGNDGKIKSVFEGVTVDGHVSQVLEAAKSA